jgi:hypothetical protein
MDFGRRPGRSAIQSAAHISRPEREQASKGKHEGEIL